VTAAAALLAAAAPAWPQARLPHRFSGSAGAFYRRDAVETLGRSSRQTYLDRVLELGVGGDLLGPRLGNYSVTGGLDWLARQGEGAKRDDARQRLDARVQVLPQSFVTGNAFYSGGRSNLAASSLESARSDGWGGGLGARLLRGGQSSIDYEKRDDRFGGALNTARTLRVHHDQGLTFGPHGLNAGWDFLDRDLESALSRIEERTRRNTGRADGRLALARAGTLGAWFQLDRERARPVRGPIAGRALDNLAANAVHEVPLGARTRLTQSWTDQLYRSGGPGPPTSVRFQIAEEKLESRIPTNWNFELRNLYRVQFSRFEGQKDVWLATWLAELAPRRSTGVSLSPRAGLNFYSGGVGDGHDLGEVLGLTLNARGGPASFELSGGREKTRGIGLRGRIDGRSAGFSPRQVGAQLIHTLHAAAGFAAGPFATNGDYEFQRIQNTTLGLDFLTHRVHGAANWRASQRLSVDVGGDYSTADNQGIYFQNDWRSVSGTLAATLRPTAATELRSQGTYGRVPGGSRETYRLLENTAAWHFPMLELALVHRLERRAPGPGAFDIARAERLLELRATRRFSGFL
jgi:hypothetical protein